MRTYETICKSPFKAKTLKARKIKALRKYEKICERVKYIFRVYYNFYNMWCNFIIIIHKKKKQIRALAENDKPD